MQFSSDLAKHLLNMELKHQKQPLEVFHKKMLLSEIPQNSQVCNFIKKETMAQVFSCEFCEISKNAFFTEHLRATASVTRTGITRKKKLFRNLLN